MDVVNSILGNQDELKLVRVDKEIELEIEEGSLLASDYNTFDTNLMRKNLENYLKDLARDNTQLLVNNLFNLPTKRVDEAITAELPKTKYILPRARRVPKPKAPTKWEQFAKEKGIKKKKKEVAKKKWDEVLQKFVPTFGYQQAKAEKQKDWLVEINKNNEVSEDPFTAKTKAKGERRSKNEFQRLRNLAKTKNIRIPRVGLPSATHFPSATQLGTAVTVARASTASVGKFQERLPKEKDSKEKIASEVPGLKRKRVAPPANAIEEKRRNQNIVENVLKGKSSIVQFAEPSTSEPSSRKKTGKKGKTSSSAKKPKAGKGKREPPKRKQGGRKRRQ